MITNIFILAFVIWGIASLFEEGMILGKVGSMIERSHPRYKLKWYLKPVILCVVCMPSIWGSAASLYLGYDIAHWLTLVFATAGLNFIIANR